MEKTQMREHIFRRNMHLWGRWAFRSEAVFLFTTAINGIVLCVMSKTTSGALYYMVLFFLLFMEMFGMLMQQPEYVKRHFPLAISLGSGRMESVWGMQLANLLLYLQILFVLGIGMRLEGVVAGGEAVGIRNMEGMRMPLLAGALLFVAAVGQLLAAVCLKWREWKSIWRVVLFIVGIAFSSAVIAFFGGQILFFMDGKILSCFVGLEKMFPTLLQLMKAVGPAGLLLYVIGFFEIKKRMNEYEV